MPRKHNPSLSQEHTPIFTTPETANNVPAIIVPGLMERIYQQLWCQPSEPRQVKGSHAYVMELSNNESKRQWIL